MKTWMMRLADALSEKRVLIVSPSSILFMAALIGASVLYICLCLNQSSIGMWSTLYGPSLDRPVISLGSAKGIRSDEWNTLTPWILNQYANGFKPHNDNVGGENAAVLTGTPVSGLLTLAQPKFWGLYVLPEAYGFSWSWAWKTFATIGALFVLLLALTDGNNRWAIIGTAWIYGSSFTQWWLSNGLPEMICGFALAVVGSLYLLRSQKWAGLLFGAAAVTFAVCNELTYLYPAFQYPLLWLAIAAVVGKTLEDKSWSLIWTHKAARSTAVFLCALAIGIFAYHFAQLVLPTAQRVLNTVYPGKRVSMGGDVPFYRLFDGFFEGFRLGETQHPLSGNASEAANYVLLFPFAILLVPFREIFRKDQALLICLTVYCLFVCTWIGLPLPNSIRSMIAAAGWNLSPPIRSVLGVGIGSIVLTAVIAARIANGTLKARKSAWVIPLVAALVLIIYGRSLNELDRGAFGNLTVLAGASASALILSALHRRRVTLAAIGVGMFIIMPLGANPLMGGLSPILTKPILLDAKKISSPTDHWMVVGNFVFSQGLKAIGLSVVTGSEYLPDQATIRALDPERKNSAIWNRYAHIIVASNPADQVPVLKLDQADLYTASLDVCGPAPRAWGVTLVAYTVTPPQSDLKCLQPVQAPTADRSSGVFLFRLKSLP